MDRLHLMTVFVSVAEEQGFAAAARRLQMSPPAVTRAVAALEDALGIKLLNRTTRYVRVTDAGQRYLEDVKKIIADVKAAEEAAAGINAEPQGHLTVTAPVLFGQKFVMPGIVEYLQRYPKTQVDAVFLDRVVNILEEGIDVGIRIGELPDSSMRALKVGTVRLIVCASANYLEQRRIPQSPEELSEKDIIKSRAARFSHDWIFQHAGKDLVLKSRSRLSVTTNDAAIRAVKNGFGVARLLSYQVADELASGEFKIILEDFEPEPRPVHIVHREGHLASTKVRAFIDLMAERLRNEGALN